ncbi:MAG: hypothetical protein CVV02_14560 [Firmicutes bacterium HGW-Firmicutes-7]|nr:MAG: hypothetical protein CVV02_14560 [Firmicutes bacterium HGW-Firmicutes-7]
MSKNKVLRIPIISVVTGIIISIISTSSVFIIARGTNEWTIMMGDIILYVEVALSVVLFITTGLLYLKDMSKKDILRSSLIVVIYYVLLVGLEQLLIMLGKYPIAIIWLFTPLRLYGVIHQVLLRLDIMSVWSGLILSIVAPFLYVIFGKSKREI